MNDTAASDNTGPLTWVLTGHKAGDNSQLLALAGALGWPFEVKRFQYRRYELLTNRLLGVTLAGIDPVTSSALRPPWPDLILTAGRRNEPVARWTRRASGGRSRLVHVGRPWADLDHFDLIVTTPQYFLPRRDNVLHNQLPLHAVTPERLAVAAGHWRGRLADLPPPRVAVLVGGNSGPFVFTPAKGVALGRLADAMARERGGSLLVTDSARTPDAFFRAMVSQIRVPAHIHRWRGGGRDNPYLAYLALADHLVVTGESMSMLAEAAATRHPLYIFDPGDNPAQGKEGGARPWWLRPYSFRFRPLSHRLAMRLGPRRMRRDVGNIQRALVHSGRAVWLGERFPEQATIVPPRDLERASARVRALFESG
ncbi:MAG: mitochondrial fission ELM1 family protein [Gammaproteobacteria bacterium]|jgi:mitochondrial fission protein ELM1